jgi:uncharacterized protein (TIGR03435 family)
MRAIVVFVLLAGLAVAQTAPPLAFEVASVRINEPFLGHDNRWQGTIETSPGSLIMRKVTWLNILTWAYRLPVPQIAGPSWLELETYDIVAKAGRPAGTDELRSMLQALLADRFKLTCHRETREIAGLALAEVKGGHKMKPPESEDQPSVTMSELADSFAAELRIPVADMTGLKGRYQFTFAILRPYFQEFRRMQPYDPVAAYQAGLQKELGLKLESRKAPMEVLVIDHIEKKPVDN